MFNSKKKFIKFVIKLLLKFSLRKIKNKIKKFFNKFSFLFFIKKIIFLSLIS